VATGDLTNEDNVRAPVPSACQGVVVVVVAVVVVVVVVAVVVVGVVVVGVVVLKIQPSVRINNA